MSDWREDSRVVDVVTVEVVGFTLQISTEYEVQLNAATQMIQFSTFQIIHPSCQLPPELSKVCLRWASVFQPTGELRKLMSKT